MLLPALFLLAASNPLPYHLASPQSPTGREHAIIIALHGALSTPAFYCSTFLDGQLSKLAEERGYIAVCAGGVGMRPRYENHEARLLDLRDELLKRYPSAKKVFLTGHSLGGRGALLIGLKNPDKFDGIAAVAPALKIRNPGEASVNGIAMLLTRYDRPVFFGWGWKDLLVGLTPVDIARLTAAGHGLVELHPYNATHLTVGRVSIADIVDFFDRQYASATLVENERSRIFAPAVQIGSHAVRVRY